jgi:subtilisin family serine protease
LEALQEALRHEPHIISVSLAYVLDGQTVPNSLKALEAEINATIAAGVVVVAAAGNGVRAFPAQMPDVIAAGGAYFDDSQALRASDYSAAFRSEAYSGRDVPDLCGLVGPAPHADYIMLPVPPLSLQDQAQSAHDSTTAADGWAVMSGTSAAAPQIAGVCALLLQRNPNLKPAALKALLERTARDVRLGRASPRTDPNGIGLQASVARDSATGAGLVDAFRAWQQA